jgi:hypothetical protein
VWRFISLKLWQGPSTWSCMQNLTMWSKSIETDKSCLTTVHNTLENDTLLKKHPHSRPVFKGVYARNSLPCLLNVPSALVGNTDPDHRMGQPWVATPGLWLALYRGCINLFFFSFFFDAMSCTSMNEVKNAMMSAHGRSFFLYLNGIVSPTRTMFVHKVHVSPWKGWCSRASI